MKPAGRPLQVALIHYTAPPIVGGVERVIGRHSTLMADAGHEVRIIAGRGASPDPRVAFVPLPLADSIHTSIVRVSAELATGTVPAEFADLVGALAADLEPALAGVEIAIAHNVASLNLNLALTAALRSVTERRRTTRLVLWHHDLAWTMPRYRPALHDGEPWSLLNTVWPGAAQVTISEKRRADLAALLEIPAASIDVIPGGVDVPAPLGETASGELDPLLLAPLRITPRKNLELAMRAVAELRRRGRMAGLVVSGPVDPHDSGERSYLNTLLDLRRQLGLDGAVVFMAETRADPPSESEVRDLYTISDALLLPSWDEGFGLPILEAGLCRLPLICSDLPTTRAIAGDAAAYFAPDADPADVATAILQRIDGDPAAALARRVRTEYAWTSVYSRFIEPLLRRVASGL